MSGSWIGLHTQPERRSAGLARQPEPCELLAWDTEFWGVRIGRVLGDRLDPDRVDAWARDNRIACLYLLSRDEPGAAAVAEGAGFRLMDVHVELARTAAGGNAPSLRKARPGDEPVLRSFAREHHRITRFYADPHFPDDRCDDLYETWIVRSLQGWAEAVLVAELDGRVVGYMTVHADTGALRGSLGLASVARDTRGQGIGKELVHGALGWCTDHGLVEVSVATQARNVPALRTFEACGFRIRSVGLWFHKWYEP